MEAEIAEELASLIAAGGSHRKTHCYHQFAVRLLMR